MAIPISRRRFITFVAAAAGLPLLLHQANAGVKLARWDGNSLGAPASIQLYHADGELARRAIAAALACVTAQDAMNWFASCGYSFI